MCCMLLLMCDLVVPACNMAQLQQNSALSQHRCMCRPTTMLCIRTRARPNPAPSDHAGHRLRAQRRCAMFHCWFVFCMRCAADVLSQALMASRHVHAHMGAICSTADTKGWQPTQTMNTMCMMPCWQCSNRLRVLRHEQIGNPCMQAAARAQNPQTARAKAKGKKPAAPKATSQVRAQPPFVCLCKRPCGDATTCPRRMDRWWHLILRNTILQ